MRKLLFALLTAALSDAFTACNQQTHPGCALPIALIPSVQLLYPIPNSTGVADSTTVLVYNVGPGAHTGGPQVPIMLSVGSASPTALSPTALPSPLPSPIASPANPATGNFAVSLPALSHATTYSVTATVTEEGCGLNQPDTGGIGSFTTQ